LFIDLPPHYPGPFWIGDQKIIGAENPRNYGFLRVYWHELCQFTPGQQVKAKLLTEK
jgi:hypothetical protein